MGLFEKKPPQQTVLLLDIENGSVGSTLAQLAPGHAPRLFGEYRVPVPLLETRSAAQLLRAVEHASSDALLHMSEVAARLRNHAKVPAYVDKIVVFFGAPWGVPNLAAGRPDFSTPLQETLLPRIDTLFGPVPVALHAHASAAVHGLRALYPGTARALLVSINGEISELLLMDDAKVVGHATAPVGVGTVLRTLRSHGGMSTQEARSALSLGHANEAALAAAQHYAGEFKQVARELFAGQAPNSVYVLAPEPMGEWFARSLEVRSLADLFPQGGVVRAMRTTHLAPFVLSTTPDLHLGLCAMYANAAHAHSPAGKTGAPLK